MKGLEDVICDALLIAFGGLLIGIFVQIEIFGMFGKEANNYIRWFEMVMGVPVIILGIRRFNRDLKRHHGN